MSLDYSQLKEPVTREDVNDQEEYLECLLCTQKDFVARIRFQYQQETWISTELEEIVKLMEQACERLAALRETNCFPPET
jgi:frataxin-like iron-binding protein CyaY